MRLTIVGCAPAWSREPGSASSCYLIEHDDRALLLDLGQGAFSELNRYRDPASVDAVLVSHLHPDHFIDLVPLRHYLKYGNVAGAPPVVRGPAQLRRRLADLTGDPDFSADLSGDPLRPGHFRLGGLSIEARHVTHIEDSFAFRVSDRDVGGGLVYSGDCADANDLVRLIQRGDTVLCEAFYGARHAGGPMHLSAAQAADAAERGGAARLILTHVAEEGDDEALRAAAAGFRGNLLIARAGLTLELG